MSREIPETGREHGWIIGVAESEYYSEKLVSDGRIIS